MNIYEFMNSSPVLTFFLAFFFVYAVCSFCSMVSWVFYYLCNGKTPPVDEEDDNEDNGDKDEDED